MGEERKRKSGRGASKRTNRVRFYPVSRTTECGARLRTNHPPLCNYLSLFLSAGRAVLISDDNGLAPLQFRRNLCQRGPPTSHVRSGALCCESERVREESERNKIDPLEERKEGRGKRPNKKEGFQAKRQRRRERAGANPPSSSLPSLGGVGNSRWLTGENEK